MIVGDRIRARLEALGKPQAWLARQIGVTPQAVSKLVTGGTTDTARVYDLATTLQTSVAYLKGETDDPAPDATAPASPQVMAEQLDLVAINEISLEFGMGATVLHDDHTTIRRYVPRDWISHFSKSDPSMLVFARGRGDSMHPTILDGDLVLIDLGDTVMKRQDEIWAVGYGDLGGLKRLRSMGKGKIKIMSANPDVSDDIFDVEEIRIIGRVCGNLRKL
jgi:phage repressor protein C with HTH and peptisase S24 domain